MDGESRTTTGVTISAGDVYHLWCNVCTPQKYKFFVVAYTEPKIRYFLINSKPTEFQLARPHLMESMVVLPASAHSFLKYDSYMNCTEVLGGATREEVQQACSTDPRAYLGRIAEPQKQVVKQLMVNSRLLTGKEKQAILAAW